MGASVSALFHWLLQDPGVTPTITCFSYQVAPQPGGPYITGCERRATQSFLEYPEVAPGVYKGPE